MASDPRTAAFGIGCLSFEQREPLDSTFTWGQHFRRLQTVLADIGTVSALTFSLTNELEDARVRIPTGRLFDGEGASPPRPAELKFSIRVPASFQRTEMPYEDPTVENWRVWIRYPYFMPVAFVISDDPDDPNPSGGVRIVREFLTSRLAEREDVRMDFLGPSPFHADCYMGPRESRGKPESAIECRRVRQPGYDRLKFTYDPSAHDVEAALESLFAATEDELGFLYLLTWLDMRRLRKWRAIQEVTAELTDLHRRTGIRAYCAKLLRTGGLTSEAFISLADFESDALMQESSLRESFEDIYRASPVEFFREDVEESMRRPVVLPSSQSAELFERFERRRSRSLENLALIVGPVLGVLIGALIASGV